MWIVLRLDLNIIDSSLKTCCQESCGAARGGRCGDSWADLPSELRGPCAPKMLNITESCSREQSAWSRRPLAYMVDRFKSFRRQSVTQSSVNVLETGPSAVASAISTRTIVHPTWLSWGQGSNVMRARVKRRHQRPGSTPGRRR